MNPTLDFRSRNSQKPFPVSQRIQGFEEKFYENKRALPSPRSNNAYIYSQSKLIQSDIIENPTISLPESLVNISSESNQSLNPNICNKHENITGIRDLKTEVITIHKDTILITSNSTQNLIDKQYSYRTGKATAARGNTNIIRNRISQDLPPEECCDIIPKDSNQRNDSTSNIQESNGYLSKFHTVNLTEHNPAYKSHPYQKALPKSITAIHYNQVHSSSRANSVTSQNEKLDSVGNHHKKISNGIYKPVYSRQTRYPNPNKLDSTPFPSNTTIRSHHRINLQTVHSNNCTSNNDDLSLARTNISKFSSTKLTTPKSQYNIVTGADLTACKTNPSLSKLQSPNVTNNRPKGQNRIFEPENMDFSQLSNNINLITPLSSEKVNTSIDSSLSRVGEIPLKTKSLPSSPGDSISHFTCIESPQQCTSKIDDEHLLRVCPNVNSYSVSSEQGKLLAQPDNNFNSSPILNRIYSSDLKCESECFDTPNSISDITASGNDTNANYNRNSNYSSQINFNSFTENTLPKMFESKKQPILTNALATKQSTVNLKENTGRLFTTNQQESNYNSAAVDFQDYTEIQYRRPISFAKIDVQNWIKDTIDVKDSITAAFLISSHIFEKTSFYIAQRHALEQKETENIINDHQAQIKRLLDANIVLRKKLFFLLFENIRSSTLDIQLISNDKYQLFRMCSLPATFNDNTFLKYKLEDCDFSNPPKLSVSRMIQCQACAILPQKNSKDAKSTGSDQNEPTMDLYYPSPPPNLPELDSSIIPLPPPDLPITQQRLQNDLERSNISKPIKIKKGITLKPLHWKRLCLPNRKNKAEIVWKMLPKQKMKSNELNQFEESFSTHPPRKIFKSIRNQNNQSSKLPIEILPQEIARQLGIVCKKFEGVHIHLEDIEEMLYSGDFKRSNLTTSILESLSKLITNERIHLVYDYVSQNPKAELTKESRTIQFFSNIPHVNMRFQHILYMQNFEEDIEHIHRNLNTIYHCCSKLRNSYELRILLSIILMLGNYMNQTYDSFKEAVGFNLELLPRLKETKTVDNSSNFLDFVSRCYLLNFEHNISHGSITNILPFPDTGDLFIASKITLNEVYDALRNLGDQLTKIRENTRHFLKDTSNGRSEEYVELVESFFRCAEKKIANEIDFWKVGEKTYQELIYYFYGESKGLWSHPDTCDFFGLWCNFASSFKEALAKAHKNIAIKRRNEFIKSDTKIIPLCPSGLKQKVRHRTGSKSRIHQSTNQ